MSDLVKRLRIKAGMIEMGERIAWGSDSALMREAADALEMTAPDVEGEPVAMVDADDDGTWADILPNVTVNVGQILYAAPHPAERPPAAKFKHGDRVRKTKGSQWKGRVVGTYSTELTPEGYAVESDTEKGSVQIYPVVALELVGEDAESDVAGLVEALEGLLPFVTSDSVECRGDKCREHWCLSCWDEETVRETVKNIRTATAKADEALAAHRKGGEK